VAFLEALGVRPSTARADAEGMEHHVSEETLSAMERYLGAEPRKKSSAKTPRSSPRG